MLAVRIQGADMNMNIKAWKSQTWFTPLTYIMNYMY